MKLIVGNLFFNPDTLFGTLSYYVNTVGEYGNAEVIKAYVKNQGKEYKEIHLGQLELL